MIGRVKEKKEVAKDTLQVVFELDEPFTFKAGQYCFITLKKLNFPDERGSKRHFSIANSPNEKGIITFTTRLRDSGFKKTLHQLPLGEEVELGPIAGVFILPENTDRPLVFIAGGIGITPYVSMLRYIAEEQLPYKITLLYSNRDRSSALFLGELENLKLRIKNLKLILTMTDDPSWTGEKRRIDTQFIIRVLRELQSTSIKEYFPEVNAQSYMVVGPPPMVEAVERALKEAGVDQANIKIENFTGY